MIKRVDDRAQLKLCLDIIHKSFKTVALDFNITKENFPFHSSFIPLEKLEVQFNESRPMFLYVKDNEYVGYFSLYKNSEKSFKLNNLAVLPEYRHLGIGKAIVIYAKKFISDTYNANQLTISIIEENKTLKEWYKSLGFIHTGTQKFEHLPFTISFMEMNW